MNCDLKTENVEGRPTPKTPKQLVFKSVFTSAIVSGHNHKRNTDNNCVGLQPENSLTSHLNSKCTAQQLVSSNFAKTRESIKQELCLNIIIYSFFHHSLLSCRCRIA